MASLTLEPLIPLALILALGLIVLPFVTLTIWQGRRGGWLRSALFLVLLAALLNPQMERERREAQPDIVLVVIDASQSQEIAKRTPTTKAAADHLIKLLEKQPDTEVRTIIVHSKPLAEAEEGTTIMGEIDKALDDVPTGRLGGVFLISDGQIHDRSESFINRADAGPLHLILSGEKNERDRRLVIDKAPSFGIVGQSIDITYRIDDRTTQEPQTSKIPAKVTVRVNGLVDQSIFAPINETDVLTIDLDRPGQHLVEIDVEEAPGELSTLNNKAALRVNAVHDRLRVLLVSGQPHLGERTWRDLLKSDAAIDLVHFTILRPPEKDDFTPLHELALIVFPVKQLFQEKLRDFDLIVFDRYVVRDVLPPSYLQNIVDYVDAGGAMLLAGGPEFAGPRSLYRTPLAAVIPATPTGRVIEQGFKPRLSPLGRRHPVTGALGPDDPTDGGEPKWGRWFRQADVRVDDGMILMSGPDGLPLLVLKRYGDGRVAQLTSDQVWLWAREFEGGGPHRELMRRLAHWLMKEPELEEESLMAHVAGDALHISRRALEAAPEQVVVTGPDGAESTLPLTAGAQGLAVASMPVKALGVYRIDDGERLALAVAGALNPREFQDLRTTPEKLAPIVTARGGQVLWAVDGLVSIRKAKAGHSLGGRGWLGVIDNKAFRVAGLDRRALMPWWFLAPLLLVLLGLAWRKEGR